MKVKSLLLLVSCTLCFVTKSFAQPKKYIIKNGIAVFGGLTTLDIQTDNFVTKESNGFLFGMSATVDIPHKFYNMSYGLQLSENYFEIAARPSMDSEEIDFVKYKMFAAQASLQGHIKLIGGHITLDVGPMLQYNGELELKNTEQEALYINNYDNLTAQDITSINRFNFNGIIGASAGYGFFKVRAQYIYGFTNILKKLEDQNFDTTGGESRFKGNQSMWVFGAMITF